MSDENKTEDNGAAEDGADQAGNGLKGDPAPEVSNAVPPPDPLVTITAERDKLKDQLLRTLADFDNYRKRARKDVEEANRRGKEDTVREVLAVADNLERAIQAADKTKDVKAVVDGVRMVLRLFEDALDRVGVTRLKAVGERFDPALHDAIQQVETDEFAAGTIVTELAPGYRLGEKLVRAALVGVARAKVKAASEPGDSDGPSEKA